MESESTSQIKHIKTHNSEQFFHLPEEILEDILHRLPVKLLLKFRCVSKPWRSLIDSDGFIKKHLDNSSKDPTFSHHNIILNTLGPRPRCGLKQCSLPSMFNDSVMSQFAFSNFINTELSLVCLVGCCNGLACILLDCKYFILWNPSTRKTKRLPAMDRKIKYGQIMNYGFGFDELSGDYKVFAIASFFWVSGRYEALCKVYSLQTNSWKLVKNGNVSPFDKQGKFACGKLHWDRLVLGLSDRCNIVSFDLRSEDYGAVELPCFPNGCVSESMGVVGGCLSVLCDYLSHLDMWVMKDYGVKESWEKVVTIPHLHSPMENRLTSLFTLGPNGEVLLTYGSTFIIYYPEEDDGFRHCQVTHRDPFREIDVYVESLVSLGGP